MYLLFDIFYFYNFTFIFFTMDECDNVNKKEGEEINQQTFSQLIDENLVSIVLAMLGKIAIVIPKFVFRVTGGSKVSEDKKSSSEKCLESLAFQVAGMASTAAMAITQSEVAKLQILQSLYTTVRTFGEEEKTILDTLKDETISKSSRTESMKFLLDKFKEEIDNVYLKIRENIGEEDDVDQIQEYISLLDVFMEVSQLFGGDEIFLRDSGNVTESAQNLKKLLE